MAGIVLCVQPASDCIRKNKIKLLEEAIAQTMTSFFLALLNSKNIQEKIYHKRLDNTISNGYN